MIKGGGTQQAKDAIQQQHSLYTRQQVYAQYGPDRSADGNGASDQSIDGATNNSSSTALVRSKSRRVSEHTMTLRRLQRFYAENESGGEPGDNPRESDAGHHAGGGTAAFPALGAPPSSSAQAPATPAAEMGHTGSTISQSGPVTKVVSSTGAIGGGGGGDARTSVNGTYPSVVAGGQWMPNNRPRTCPLQKGQGKKMGLSRENVPHLLLRAMVGYDWVDDFNGQEVRVRGAFTERDVGILEVYAYG